jgi:hypothetical protein
MIVMMMKEMIGPVLGAGRAYTKRRETQRHHRVWYPRLEQALSGLAAIVAHLRFLVGLLQPLLRRVTHIIALMNVGDLARVVSHFDQVLGVFLSYHSGWHELFARQDLQTRRLAAAIA